MEVECIEVRGGRGGSLQSAQRGFIETKRLIMI